MKRSILVCISLIFIAHSSLALSLKLYENGKYKTVKITDHQGAKLSESCVKKGKATCTAWTVFSGKPATRSKAVKELLGNPAALYCGDLKSKNRILKDEAGNQYDYCVFDDGSMVDSWTIYNKHFGT